MTLDADIQAAGSQLALNKIIAQDERNARATNKAYKDQQIAILTGLADWAKGQYAQIDVDYQAGVARQAEERALQFKRNVILALIPKYMTTGTAKDPALVQADAADDAARLAAAAAEILKLAP